MIWHNHEGMQEKVPEDFGVVVDGLHDHVCDGRLAEVDRSLAGFVQQPIDGGKCLSRVERVHQESAIGWQTVVETPSEEDRLVNLVAVRKPPPVERHA